jgi:hypothetical protein
VAILVLIVFEAWNSSKKMWETVLKKECAIKDDGSHIFFIKLLRFLLFSDYLFIHLFLPPIHLLSSSYIFRPSYKLLLNLKK